MKVENISLELAGENGTIFRHLSEKEINFIENIERETEDLNNYPNEICIDVHPLYINDTYLIFDYHNPEDVLEIKLFSDAIEKYSYEKSEEMNECLLKYLKEIRENSNDNYFNKRYSYYDVETEGFTSTYLINIKNGDNNYTSDVYTKSGIFP